MDSAETLTTTTTSKRPSPTLEIFSRIKEELEHGTVPWHKPWVVREDAILSYVSGKPYSLRNRMLLSFAGEYATFHQIKKCGGTLRKGSHGQMVFFAKWIDKKDKITGEVTDTFHILRAYYVFNIQDTDLTPRFKEKWSGESAPKCDALKVVTDYCTRTGVVFREAGGHAFYSVGEDTLQVPNIDTFNSEVEFWSTVFHEVAHSTGKRLGREYGVAMLGLADDKYCKEELVAEITAALCLGRLGLNTEDTVINSGAYIKHWLGNLSHVKPTDFGDACRQAQLACDFIFNTQHKESDNE